MTGLRILFCVFLMLANSVHAEHGIQPQVSMRQYGYQLGDVLTQTVMLPLHKGQQLDARSLPLPGPVRPWLDLRAVNAWQTSEGVLIKLEWQVFATVETVQTLSLPAFTLKLRGPAADVVKVPAYTFLQSPVLGSQVQTVPRKPSRPALLYDVQRWQWCAGIALGLSVLFVLLALWLRDALPWWPWQPGPLHKVQRSRRLSSVANGSPLLYQALCQTAGCVLHADNLPKLYLKAPWLRPLQRDIDRFVEVYLQQQYAYRPLPPTAHTIPDADDAWLAQAVLLERLSRKARQVGR